MSFANRYGYDKKSAEEGKWITKGDGLDIQVRRLNSKAVRDLAVRVNKPFTHLTRGGKSLPTDIADLVNRRIASEGVLMDWRDTPVAKGEKPVYGAPRPFREENGKIVMEAGTATNMTPFSVEAAAEFFQMFPDFLEEVIEDSSIMDNFRDDEVEETVGNS